MSPDRRERRPFWKTKEAPGILSVEEFMEIRDLEQARTAIAQLYRDRFSTPT